MIATSLIGLISPYSEGTAVQIAAHDVSRLSRAVAGCAGVAVAVFGALTAARVVGRRTADRSPRARRPLCSRPGWPFCSWSCRRPARPSGSPPTLLAARHRHGRRDRPGTASGGRRGHRAGRAGAGLHRRPASAAGRVARPATGSPIPLLAGAAIIALVALVPRMFAPTFPDGSGPDSVMSPYVAGRPADPGRRRDPGPARGGSAAHRRRRPDPAPRSAGCCPR